MRTSKNRRAEEAIARQEKFNELTLEQRIAKLDKMFGKKKGAAKERAKIVKQIEKRDQPKEKVIEVMIPVDEDGNRIELIEIAKPKKKAKERRKENKEIKHKNK
jgi:hypothetical protein